MLDPIDEGVWAIATPHVYLGLHLGTRMTVVRLRDGTLLLHSPVRLDPALRREVDALGTVAHVVAPNLFHHVFAGAWAAAYPDAMLHAPAPLRRKRPDLRIDADLGASAHASWEGTLVPHVIEGTMLAETVFVMPGLRTVLSSDLTENFTSHDHFVTRQYLKLAGTYGRPGWPRPLRLTYRDRRAARRSIDALLEHDFDRVILAHGQIIERGGREAVRQTFEGWLP